MYRILEVDHNMTKAVAFNRNTIITIHELQPFDKYFIRQTYHVLFYLVTCACQQPDYLRKIRNAESESINIAVCMTQL